MMYLRVLSTLLGIKVNVELALVVGPCLRVKTVFIPVCVPRDPRGGNSSSILAEWICSSCQENFCKVKISVILLCYGSGILYYK